MKNIAASSSLRRGYSGIRITLHNSDVVEFQRVIKQIGVDMERKVVGKALRAGGAVFIREAKFRSPSDRIEARIKGVTKTVNGVKGYIAGPVVGTFPNPAWFELGTLSEYTGWGRSKGSYVVKRSKRLWGADANWYTLRAGMRISQGIRPRKFLQPAFDTKYTMIVSAIHRTLNSELAKYNKK